MSRRGGSFAFAFAEIGLICVFNNKRSGERDRKGVIEKEREKEMMEMEEKESTQTQVVVVVSCVLCIYICF